MAAVSKLALIGEFDAVLSLGLLDRAKVAPADEPKADGELVAKIEAMIRERAEAKAAKDYAKADEIRAALTEMGVTLKDSREGTTYTIG